MVNTLSILYQFGGHFGIQMGPVLELQGVHCQFGGSLGGLKSVKFEVRESADIGGRPYRVFLNALGYMETCWNMCEYVGMCG